MPKPSKQSKKVVIVRIAISGGLVALAAIVLAKNWATVADSLRAAKTANAAWLVPALLCTAITYLIAAATYNILAIRRLRYKETVLVELSTAFVNRLLPAGLGGLGVHGVYLYRRKHTATEATAVVSVNNALGMAAHLLLLGSVLMFDHTVFNQLAKHFHIGLNIWLLPGVLLALVLISLHPWVRQKLAMFAKNFLISIRKIGSFKVARAFVLAAALTVTYTSILYMCTHALQLSLNPVQVFVVFSVGMLFSTATPTPGGLVGAEAGLFAGFVGYGVPTATAGAVVLLYRLATYWIPLLPGLAALSVARARKIL